MIMSKGVYKIVNPNGEIFIGSSLNLKNTLRKFNTNNKVIYDFKKTLRSGDVSLLYLSYWLYGFKKHKMEIIEELEVNEKIKDKVNDYIVKYNPRLNRLCDKELFKILN